MNFSERLIRAAMRGEEIPLEGRAKITLTNERTGKKEVIEAKNAITNGLSHILNSNYTGTADFARILPLKQFFSGVLCYNLPFDSVTVVPPSEAQNPLIACAGNLSHSSASTVRGNPNGAESTETASSITNVWDWTTSSGNGTIATVCLTNGHFGNCGTKPVEPFEHFMLCADNGSAASTTAAWSRSEALKCPIEIVDDQTCLCLFVNKVGQYSDGTTFEEITVKHDFTTFGIIRGVNDYVEESSRTATIRSRTNRWGVCFDEDYYYVYSVTDATHLQVDKIDRDTFTVTTADLTLSGVSLYTGFAFRAYVQMVTPQYPFDGTYLYLPDSLATGMIKINLSDESDCARLTGTLANAEITTSSGNQNTAGGDAVVIGAGLAYGDRYMINGNTLYEMTKAQNGEWKPTNQSSSSYSYNTSNLYIKSNNPACFVGGHSTEESYFVGRGLCINRMFLSTNLILPETVTKTVDKSMKISYTIAEAT